MNNSETTRKPETELDRLVNLITPENFATARALGDSYNWCNRLRAAILRQIAKEPEAMAIKYISKEQLTTPHDGCEVITNSWWWEKDGMILDWEFPNQRVPQCNKSKAVIDHCIANDVALYRGHTPVFIELAFYRR